MTLPWKQLGSILLLLAIGISQTGSQQETEVFKIVDTNGVHINASTGPATHSQFTISRSAVTKVVRFSRSETIRGWVSVASGVAANDWRSAAPSFILGAYAQRGLHRLGIDLIRSTVPPIASAAMRLAIQLSENATDTAITNMPDQYPQSPLSPGLTTVTMDDAAPWVVWTLGVAVWTGLDSLQPASTAVSAVLWMKRQF